MNYAVERIRQEMKAQGLGPYTLAKRTGLALLDIRQILNLDFIENLAHLESIAKALGIDPDEMIALADKTWWEQRTVDKNVVKGIEYHGPLRSFLDLRMLNRDPFPHRTT